MVQEDHIMRLIHQLSQALTKVLFQKDQRQYREALETVRHTGQLFLGLDLSAVATISYEALQASLRAKNALDAQHTSLVAELLRHQGDSFAVEQDADAAHRSYTLALNLYLDLFVTEDGRALADLPARIDGLLESLDPLLLAPDIQRKLFPYLSHAGRYADAEDVLFSLADTHPTPELFAQGEAFFERLLTRPYRHLKAGNLPREEVKEGRVAFREKMKQGFLEPGRANG